QAQRRPVPDLPIAGVIHHGIRATDFPVGDGEGGYCLFLGRMSPDKGPHRAMEAAYKAGTPLLMCAKMRDPWEFDYFDEYVRPYLNDDIRYLGEVPHERKLELLAGAAALLFPIRWNEPFGMVMIEALACGTPVLAFPEGAVPEVIEDGTTGLLCRDVAELSEAITRIPTLDRRACRAAVEGYFSADRMVREHLELFETLL
ncbi:MAG: glycosyltransferase, partial [Actinomycetota bacterium]|nr:glycosyltransferase [Actinomycetota bacterium]